MAYKDLTVLVHLREIEHRARTSEKKEQAKTLEEESLECQRQYMKVQIVKC
jgi:hypothetical protein